MDPRERSKIYNGASDAWARAVELTLTPLIFGFLGYRLDLWTGTLPVFTIVFAAFCLGYEVWKLWSGYEAAMQVHEAELLARRRRSSGSPSGGTRRSASTDRVTTDRVTTEPVSDEPVGQPRASTELVGP